MREIPLITKGMVALVDDSDLQIVSRHKWYALKVDSGFSVRWYAYTPIIGEDGKQRSLLMHRLIMALTDPKISVDHQDHDGLNNRRSNLRVCSQTRNLQNQRTRHGPKTSCYKGVSWQARDGGWQTHICVDKKRIYLGRFPSERVAAFAYNQAAKRHFGEFAHLNVIEQSPRALLRLA